MTQKPMTLRCDACDREVETRVDPEDRTTWPLHRCGRLHDPQPFTTAEPLIIRLARDYRNPDPIHNERVAALLAPRTGNRE